MWFARVWFPLALAVTMVCGLLYVVMQQYDRQSLNDPQIQMAEDAAHALAGGATPASLIPHGMPIDIGASLAPWIAVYDADGTSLATSGTLDGVAPKLPAGLLDSATWEHSKTYEGTETRVTWQPREGVRQALVVVQAGNRYVVAGRNMHEVESRLWHSEVMIGLGWVATLIATFVVVWAGSYAEDFITISRA